MVTLNIERCNSCPHCEHNGRLQAMNKVFLMCRNKNRQGTLKAEYSVYGNKIGRLYGRNLDDILSHEPPVWCPLKEENSNG